jgi:dCTP deaminase
LRLDAKLQVWSAAAGPVAQATIDPSDPEFNATTLASALATPEDCSNGFEIQPGMFSLGWTIEKIQLPHTSRIAARVEGRSSLARIGIGVHVTAPTIHAGFGYRPDDPASRAIQFNSRFGTRVHSESASLKAYESAS